MVAAKYYVPIIKSAFLIIFLLSFTYFMLQLRYYYCSYVIEKCKKNLKRVALEIDMLKVNHKRLVIKIEKFLEVPAEAYETTRRKIHVCTENLWHTVRNELEKAAAKGSLTKQHRKTILKDVAERKRLLLSELEKLQSVDGYNDWRNREAENVSDLIQRRLYSLQNPSDCRSAKKLVCHHDIYGIGCNIHHLMYCLITAYNLKRTLIIDNFNKYHKMFVWKDIASPLSETCVSHTEKISPLTDRAWNESVLYLPISPVPKIESLQPHIIPKDLGERIRRFSSDPYSWWFGQILKYILKFRNPNVLNMSINKINWTSPIVGVHVRRTDKLVNEAKYHDIDEYMAHVEDFYKQIELTRPVQQRQVYIATDEYRVLKEAIIKYPQYTFYGDFIRAKMADTRYRFSPRSISGILVDLHILSLSDFVVCTFSSNIGRMAYELMQTRRLDAPNRFVSLDHSYYFRMTEERRRIAVMKNKKISLDIGDTILYKRVDYRDLGTVLRTSNVGCIPWHKTEELIMMLPYQEYKEVSLYTDSKSNKASELNQTYT